MEIFAFSSHNQKNPPKQILRKKYFISKLKHVLRAGSRAL